MPSLLKSSITGVDSMCGFNCMYSTTSPTHNTHGTYNSQRHYNFYQCSISNSYIICRVLLHAVPSVLWRCWLSGRKGIRPVKDWVVGGAGWVICLEQGADLHTAQLMPLPVTVSCISKIQIGFTFLVLAHLSPLHGRGTVCHQMSELQRHFSFSDDSSRYFFSSLTNVTITTDYVKCPCSVCVTVSL